MRKLTITATVVLALMFSGSAMAGGASVYLGGGFSMPAGTFGDLYKMGMGGAGGFGFQLSPTMEVGARVAYTQFDLDDPTGFINGGEVTTLAFLGDMKFYFTGGNEAAAFKPYATGTIGMTSFKRAAMDMSITFFGFTIGSSADEWTETALTFGFGGGFDYMFSPSTGLWFDAKYMIMNTEGSSTNHMPLRVGVKFLFGGTE